MAEDLPLGVDDVHPGRAARGSPLSISLATAAFTTAALVDTGIAAWSISDGLYQSHHLAINERGGIAGFLMWLASSAWALSPR